MRLPFRLRGAFDRSPDAAPPLPRTVRAPHLRDARGAAAAVFADPVLGCIVVRRVVDGENREWNVREMGSDTRVSDSHVAHSSALLYRCDEPGVRSEIRRVSRPLESMSDRELLVALQDAE